MLGTFIVIGGYKYERGKKSRNKSRVEKGETLD